jgi:hypothetical protein
LSVIVGQLWWYYSMRTCRTSRSLLHFAGVQLCVLAAALGLTDASEDLHDLAGVRSDLQRRDRHRWLAALIVVVVGHCWWTLVDVSRPGDGLILGLFRMVPKWPQAPVCLRDCPACQARRN